MCEKNLLFTYEISMKSSIKHLPCFSKKRLFNDFLQSNRIKVFIWCFLQFSLKLLFRDILRTIFHIDFKWDNINFYKKKKQPVSALGNCLFESREIILPTLIPTLCVLRIQLIFAEKCYKIPCISPFSSWETRTTINSLEVNRI